jgi:hypothetical protein
LDGILQRYKFRMTASARTPVPSSRIQEKACSWWQIGFLFTILNTSIVIAEEPVNPRASEDLARALRDHDFKAATTALRAAASSRVLDPEGQDVISSYLFHWLVRESVLGEQLGITAITIDAGRSQLSALIDGGADPNYGGPSGRVPLRAAAILEEGWAVKILIERGADPNGGEHQNGWPLHSALRGPSYSGAAKIASYLLAKGANPNILELASGMTPLMQAAEDGNVPAVLTLLCHGALPATKSLDGRTAIEYAKVGPSSDPRAEQKNDVRRILTENKIRRRC